MAEVEVVILIEKPFCWEYVPLNELQSALPVNVPSALKVIVYCSGLDTGVVDPFDTDVHCQRMPTIGVDVGGTFVAVGGGTVF
jgi:hypothetical protein